MQKYKYTDAIIPAVCVNFLHFVQECGRTLKQCFIPGTSTKHIIENLFNCQIHAHWQQIATYY